eukprot:scaffold221034_cov43-Tisochrysis_lutea.AAC.1
MPLVPSAALRRTPADFATAPLVHASDRVACAAHSYALPPNQWSPAPRLTFDSHGVNPSGNLLPRLGACGGSQHPLL